MRVTYTVGLDASSLNVCADKRPVHSACPLGFLQKSAGSRSQLRSKESSNGPSPENFSTIGGYFECYTYHVMVPGQLKKEEGEDRR